MKDLFTIGGISVAVCMLLFLGLYYGREIDDWCRENPGQVFAILVALVIVAQIARWWRGIRYLWDHAKRKWKKLWE